MLRNVAIIVMGKLSTLKISFFDAGFIRVMMINELSSLLPLLETIISKIDDGVLIFGKSETVYYLNPSAKKMLDIDRHQTITSCNQVSSVNIPEIIEKLLPANQATGTLESLPDTPLPPETPLPSTEVRILHKDSHRDLLFQCYGNPDDHEQDRLYFLIIKKHHPKQETEQLSQDHK